MAWARVLTLVPFLSAPTIPHVIFSILHGFADSLWVFTLWWPWIGWRKRLWRVKNHQATVRDYFPGFPLAKRLNALAGLAEDLRFSFRHPHEGSRPSVIPDSWVLVPSGAHGRDQALMYYPYTHVQVNIHIIHINASLKGFHWKTSREIRMLWVDISVYLKVI